MRKWRPPKRAPLSQSAANKGLHLLRALLGRVVPHAASLVAASLVGCFRHVSSEGGASKGKRQDQRKRRYERFHRFYSAVMWTAEELRSRAECSRDRETPRRERKHVLTALSHPRRMALTAEQHSQLAIAYEKAAADRMVPAEQRDAFSRKANWFRIQARIAHKNEQTAQDKSRAALPKRH